MIGLAVLLAPMFALAQQTAHVGAATLSQPNIVRGNDLTIPPAISPAIWPYLNCLTDSQGIPRPAQDGTVQAPIVALGADCTMQRREAAERANRLLRNRSLGNASRRAELIESALASVDRFMAELGNFAAPPPSPAVAGKAEDPLPSIDIPYQVIPAFDVYTRCVGERFVSDSRANGPDEAAVRQAHADAVAACRDVREEQLADALQLLTDYRPYGGDRTRAQQAARTAFDRFDRDYLVEASEQRSDPASPNRNRRPIPFGGVEVPDPVAPALARYIECYRAEMTRRGALPVIRLSNYRADVEASIAACASRRAEAMAEADAALARALDYRNPERRRAAIAAAFDGTDDQHRNLLAITEAIRRERGNK